MLGALYLAYDILGGKRGPLRTLTRCVTYGLLFGVGYGVPLGFAFGLAAGAANGITLALEFARASRKLGRYPFRYEVLLSVVRGIGYAVGAGWMHGPEFGAVFGILITLGQIGGYRAGMHPGMLIRDNWHSLRLTPREVYIAVLRTVGYGAAGAASALVAHHQMHVLSFGLEVGLTTGLLTALMNLLAPYMEWLTENMPDKRMGVIGVGLILTGFALQSVQYWVALFDVQVR